MLNISQEIFLKRTHQQNKKTKEIQNTWEIIIIAIIAILEILNVVMQRKNSKLYTVNKLRKLLREI